jgi:hypothetical protein
MIRTVHSTLCALSVVLRCLLQQNRLPKVRRQIGNKALSFPAQPLCLYGALVEETRNRYAEPISILYVNPSEYRNTVPTVA